MSTPADLPDHPERPASPTRPGLTAVEFHAAFKGYTPLSLADDAYELRDLERAILRYLPDAARMAQQLAEGRLSGEPFAAVFVPLERNVGRVLEQAAPLERRLWHARAAAGLAPRPFDAEANGTSATMALLGVARRVVNLVWEVVGGSVCGFDDDDDSPGIYEVMEWNSTAGELRERFSTAFRFPDSALLLHEMRMELMQLDGLVMPDAPAASATVGAREAVAAPAVVDADAPTIPMRAAAARTQRTQRTKKPKQEPEIEPLSPETTPHPVEVKQPAANPIPVYIVARPDGQSSPPAVAADPPVCRLRIEGEKVFLDGQAVTLDMGPETRGAALCMLGHLLAAGGEWVSGPELNAKEVEGSCREHDGARWDRARNALPEALRDLVESGRGKGYRLAL